MKNINKKSIIAIMAVVLFFNSLSFAFTLPNKELRLSKAITGTEYFNAIYFRRGELVSQIYTGDINDIVKNNYSSDERNDVAEIQDVIYGKIVKENPKFMDDFKKGIESKDLIIIESTIKKGAELVCYAMLNINKEALSNNKVFQKFLTGYNSSSTEAEKQACVLYQLCVLEGIIDNGIVVQQPIWVWFVQYPITSTTDQQTKLYKEQFVYNIYQLQK